MGQSATGHFQAYQKERYGWLNYGGSPAIQTVTASGTYFISAYEGGTSPSAIKILKSSSSTEKIYYYIEARTPTGFDGPYAGVDVHTGSSTNANSAYEVDLDPTTPSFDSLLDPGQTFSDAAAGLTVSTVSVDGSGAWISVTYAGTPCTTSTPGVTLSPGSSVTTPGTTASYTMTVKNNDASGCGSSNFGIGLNVPSGWNWTAAQPTVSINPGSTAGTTVYVTPPVAASGSATVTALADRTGSTGPDGSSTATLTVTNGLSVTLTTIGGSSYQLSATVAAGSTGLAGLNVTFTITDSKGSVSTLSAVTNTIGVAVVKGKLKGKDPRGTYYVSVSATSGNLTGSASGTFVY
jgi:hypothetical protein